MPKVLFVVHGMGDFLPGWSSALVQQLDETLAPYVNAPKGARPFRERVIVEEITYDAVFDKLIEPWGRQRAALDQFASDHGLSLDDTLTTLAAGQLPSDVSSFVWETLLDPVLYRGSPLVRDNVRQSVALQFLTAWDKHLTNNKTSAAVEVSVLCHSQGTIVMSDVLAQVGEARLPEYRPFSAAKRSIANFITLANVSRLGPPKLIDIDSYGTCVRPATAPDWKAGESNYLRRFINARHEFDPFCLWQRFEPPAPWGDRYVDIPGIRHLHQANTHAYLHYLLNPRVHIPLFRALIGGTTISRQAEKDAIDAFPEFAPAACQSAIDTLRDKLTAIAAAPVKDARALDAFIMRGIQVYAAAKEAMRSCHELVGGFGAD